MAEGVDGRVLLTCHAQCSLEAICTALGLRVADLFPPPAAGRSNGRRPNGREHKAYDYRDENGSVLFQVVRYVPKGFSQRRPDGNGGWISNLDGVRRVLYRVPALLAADPNAWVFIVEGEKDTDRLAAEGLIATTNPGGAGKWHLVDDKPLHGRQVCVLQDNDDAGREHRDDVARRLHGKASDVRIVELLGLPPKGDVSDWLDAGHTVAELLALVEATEPVRIAPALPVETTVMPPPAPGWEPPIPFGRYDVPGFPLEAIPERLHALREFCEAVAESVQVPLDSVVFLVLAVGGTALAKRIEVPVLPDWTEPVNIFVVVVMESGERKSAVFRIVLSPVVEYEQEENERLAPLIEQSQVELAMLVAEMKHEQGRAAKATKPDDRRAARQRVKELAEQIRTTKIILPLQLTADDATPEAIGQLLHQQSGRIALMSPEGDVFDLMAGRYSDGVGRLGVYLKGHAGDDYKLNRVSRANEYVRGPALTVGLAVQPDVLRGLMEKPGFRGRGLLARFLYSLPASLVGFRKLNSSSVPAQVLADYARLVRAALQLQPTVDAHGNPYPFVVQVSPEAVAELNRFRAWAETELRTGGELSTMRDWGSKLPGAVCRVAAIFHGLFYAARGDPSAYPLDAETMLCAIAVGEYAVAHAKAAFCEMGANPATGLARRILAWLMDGHLSEFTRRDAFNAVRGAVQRVEELDEPLGLLLEHGFIRERETTRIGPGRKPSTRYDVNPLVHAHNTQNTHNLEQRADSAESAESAGESPS
ncbi:MAG: DUF3987 domain-containing protein [Planctomycetota bacterium]